MAVELERLQEKFLEEHEQMVERFTKEQETNINTLQQTHSKQLQELEEKLEREKEVGSDLSTKPNKYEILNLLFVVKVIIVFLYLTCCDFQSAINDLKEQHKEEIQKLIREQEEETNTQRTLLVEEKLKELEAIKHGDSHALNLYRSQIDNIKAQHAMEIEREKLQLKVSDSVAVLFIH